MRSFAAQGTQFTLNGRPIFLRGTLECAIFPLTGYPPTDVAEWRRIYRIMKSYGLNFIRFHSWCPPEAAFAAADIEGMIIQAEGPQANVDAGAGPEPRRVHGGRVPADRPDLRQPSVVLPDDAGQRVRRQGRDPVALGGHAQQGGPAASLLLVLRRPGHGQPPVHRGRPSRHQRAGHRSRLPRRGREAGPAAHRATRSASGVLSQLRRDRGNTPACWPRGTSSWSATT